MICNVDSHQKHLDSFECRLHYLAESLTLVVVRDVRLKLQQGELGPGLVHLGVEG